MSTDSCVQSVFKWGRDPGPRRVRENLAMHTANFSRGVHENPRFWARLGGPPDLEGQRVMDLGCGLGSLCIDVAGRGAGSVLGFDLQPELVEFARDNLERSFPRLGGRVEFRLQDVREYEGPPFDCVMSKDTFEHIIELPSVLDAVKRCLKPGGRVYIGLGPLYESPYGDHGRLEACLPWGHLIVPERWLLRRLNRRRGLGVTRVEELGLNKWTVHDYRKLLRGCGLELLHYQENASTRPLARVFSCLRRMSVLERFCTFNIYCVLRKPSPSLQPY